MFLLLWVFFFRFKCFFLNISLRYTLYIVLLHKATCLFAIYYHVSCLYILQHVYGCRKTVLRGFQVLTSGHRAWQYLYLLGHFTNLAAAAAAASSPPVSNML